MRNELITSYPAGFWTAKWREALPAGNGKIGASVYGGVYKETILLNHEELWADIRKEPLPDIHESLPDLRRLLLEGRIEEAQPFLEERLREAGYQTSVASPLPLGDLVVTQPVQAAFREYSRRLNMETGEVTVSWKDSGVRYDRRVFVSRSADMAVVDIRADKLRAI